MSSWSEAPLLERACFVGAFFGAGLAAFGAQHLAHKYLHFLGYDAGNVIGVAIGIFVLKMMADGVEHMKQPRRDAQRRAAEALQKRMDAENSN